ncbi:MAG: M14 family zinc carboxypeptidase [Pseudomonadota bacterium]
MDVLLRQLNKPHLKQADISPLIEHVSSFDFVDVKKAGDSFEGRPIHLLSMGNGKTKIFMWSQMHGDEATATASVFDFIAMLETIPNWEKTYQIHIIPMVNPDGAERCTRQNAQAIDINRDAVALQSPEARLLRSTFDDIQPDIALNLHDQCPYYQVGKSGYPATMAFLAPTVDVEKTIPPTRKIAMGLIAKMLNAISPEIPNCIGRYDDTFSPRSFGDCFASLGASTILIESGAAANDPNRQIARRMNLLAMRQTIEHYPSLALQENIDNEMEVYFALPEIKAKTISSLLIENLQFAGTTSYQASVSIKQTTRWSGQFYIDAVGDLSNLGGLINFDASELTFEAGQVHSLEDHTVITDNNLQDWLKQGVIQFQGNDGLLDNQSSFTLLCNEPLSSSENALILNAPAYFLMRKDDAIVAAVLNGKLLVLE